MRVAPASQWPSWREHVIPDEQIDQVRQSADIVQLIGEYVDLRRTGADFRGPCPFHQGKHRNFSVSPKRERYYCFVCHEGGDIFHFIQKRLGLDFVDAVRHVAQRVGVELRETDSRRAEPDEREPLWEANAATADFFRKCLWEDSGAHSARAYLESRDVSREIADQFGLGFAPRDGEGLHSHLRALGFSDDVLVDAGLLYRREEDQAVRVRFRSRIVFPILDAAGRCVGFGGRLVGPGEPKYLNSPESRVFSKARLLYGLSWAKSAIRRDGRVLLVEGYFDVLRIAAAGIGCVVAPLGTALTDEQAKLLRRFTSTVYLFYDGDVAGLKATFRAGDVLLREGVSVMVATLPSGEDPDSFVRAHGADGLGSLLTDAVDVMERKVQELERKGYFADLRRKRRALDKLIPTIRATADPLTRELYMGRVAEAAGVGKEFLSRELDQPVRRGGAPHDRLESAVRPRDGGRDARRERERTPLGRLFVAAEGSERELVRVILHFRSYLERIAEEIGPDEFLHPAYREIFQVLLSSEEGFTPDELLTDLSQSSARLAVKLIEEGPDSLMNVDRTVADALTTLRTRRLDQEMWELNLLIPVAAGTEKDTLLQRKFQISAERRELSGGRFTSYGNPPT